MTDTTRRANGEGTVHYDPKLKRWVAMASAGRDDATGSRKRIKLTARDEDRGHPEAPGRRREGRP